MPNPSQPSAETPQIKPLPTLDKLPQWIAGELSLEPDALSLNTKQNLYLAGKIFRDACESLPAEYKHSAYSAALYASAIILVLDELTEQGTITSAEDPVITRYASILCQAIDAEETPFIEQLRDITAAMITEETFKVSQPEYSMQREVSVTSHALALQAMVVAHTVNELQTILETKDLLMCIRYITNASRAMADVMKINQDTEAGTPNTFDAFALENQRALDKETMGLFLAIECQGPLMECANILAGSLPFRKLHTIRFMASVNYHFMTLFNKRASAQHLPEAVNPLEVLHHDLRIP